MNGATTSGGRLNLEAAALIDGRPTRPCPRTRMAGLGSLFPTQPPPGTTNALHSQQPRYNTPRYYRIGDYAPGGLITRASSRNTGRRKQRHADSGIPGQWNGNCHSAAYKQQRPEGRLIGVPLISKADPGSRCQISPHPGYRRPIQLKYGIVGEQKSIPTCRRKHIEIDNPLIPATMPTQDGVQGDCKACESD